MRASSGGCLREFPSLWLASLVRMLARPFNLTTFTLYSESCAALLRNSYWGSGKFFIYICMNVVCGHVLDCSVADSTFLHMLLSETP